MYIPLKAITKIQDTQQNGCFVFCFASIRIEEGYISVNLWFLLCLLTKICHKIVITSAGFYLLICMIIFIWHFLLVFFCCSQIAYDYCLPCVDNV